MRIIKPQYIEILRANRIFAAISALLIVSITINLLYLVNYVPKVSISEPAISYVGPQGEDTDCSQAQNPGDVKYCEQQRYEKAYMAKLIEVRDLYLKKLNQAITDEPSDIKKQNLGSQVDGIESTVDMLINVSSTYCTGLTRYDDQSSDSIKQYFSCQKELTLQFTNTLNQKLNELNI